MLGVPVSTWDSFINLSLTSLASTGGFFSTNSTWEAWFSTHCWQSGALPSLELNAPGFASRCSGCRFPEPCLHGPSHLCLSLCSWDGVSLGCIGCDWVAYVSWVSLTCCLLLLLSHVRLCVTGLMQRLIKIHRCPGTRQVLYPSQLLSLCNLGLKCKYKYGGGSDMADSGGV